MSLWNEITRLRKHCIGTLVSMGYDEQYAELAAQQVDPSLPNALELIMHWIDENPKDHIQVNNSTQDTIDKLRSMGFSRESIALATTRYRSVPDAIQWIMSHGEMDMADMQDPVSISPPSPGSPLAQLDLHREEEVKVLEVPSTPESPVDDMLIDDEDEWRIASMFGDSDSDGEVHVNRRASSVSRELKAVQDLHQRQLASRANKALKRSAQNKKRAPRIEISKSRHQPPVMIESKYEASIDGAAHTRTGESQPVSPVSAGSVNSLGSPSRSSPSLSSNPLFKQRSQKELEALSKLADSISVGSNREFLDHVEQADNRLSPFTPPRSPFKNKKRVSKSGQSPSRGSPARHQSLRSLSQPASPAKIRAPALVQPSSPQSAGVLRHWQGAIAEEEAAAIPEADELEEEEGNEDNSEEPKEGAAAPSSEGSRPKRGLIKGFFKRFRRRFQSSQPGVAVN